MPFPRWRALSLHFFLVSVVNIPQGRKTHLFFWPNSWVGTWCIPVILVSWSPVCVEIFEYEHVIVKGRLIIREDLRVTWTNGVVEGGRLCGWGEGSCTPLVSCFTRSIRGAAAITHKSLHHLWWWGLSNDGVSSGVPASLTFLSLCELSNKRNQVSYLIV